MLYTFFCPKCATLHDIEIPMSEYEKEKNLQVCTNCNIPLKRKIEWKGSTSINGGYEAIAGRAKWQQ